EWRGAVPVPAARHRLAQRHGGNTAGAAGPADAARLVPCGAHTPDLCIAHRLVRADARMAVRHGLRPETTGANVWRGLGDAVAAGGRRVRLGGGRSGSAGGSRGMRVGFAARAGLGSFDGEPGARTVEPFRRGAAPRPRGV